jgi:hypothetical protein
MRIAAATILLLMSTPLAAQSRTAAEPTDVPQPVVLDWTGRFRLNAPPNNAAEAHLKAAEAAEQARNGRRAGTPSPASAAAALRLDDRNMTRTSYRRLESEEPTLDLRAPMQSGPVSLGASYGDYRVVPDTNGVSTHDVRVKLGVAF